MAQDVPGDAASGIGTSVQIESQAHSTVVMTTAGGSELPLDPGRQLVARVIDASSDGTARISLAGQTVNVSTTQQLTPGQTLSLTVLGTSDGQVRLGIGVPAPTQQVAPAAQAALVDADQLPAPVASARLSDVAPAAIRELARAGVSVTPDLVQVASKVIEQLAATSSSAGSVASTTDGAARVAAQLIARGLGTSPDVAGRVAAALDTAGHLGTALGNLARQSPTVAAALPNTTPGAGALRSLLTTSLQPVELAVARIAQAIAATSGAPVTAPPLSSIPTSANPVVVANYVASQLAGAASLETLSAAPATMVATNLAQQAATAAPQPGAIPGAPSPAGATPAGAAPAGVAPPPLSASATQAPASATGTTAAAQAAQTITPPASAATAVQSGAGGTTTPPAVVRVVTELATAVVRFAPSLVSSQSALGATAASTTTGTPQPLSGDGFTPVAAGGSAAGAPAPLIAGLRESLSGSGSGAGSGSSLLNLLSRFDAGQIRAALAQLPEGDVLQIAGKLLQSADTSGGGAAAQALRHSIHSLLADLGRALAPAQEHELAALRHALGQVAANDPRGHVAAAAQQLLDAADGQVVLSHARGGADPGYAYFQVPLPDNRSAEVLVRREAGRRTLSFDTFNIAFLLNTEQLGTLMIQLDAHPAGIRAMVRTDLPDAEPFIAAQADALREPLEREARRPLSITTGVFASGSAPPSLLEPELGLVPGENAYYA